jgi:hypothetical protein
LHWRRSLWPVPGSKVTSQKLSAIWRKQIVSARITLALSKLNPRQQADLWQLIETGERFLEMNTHAFLGQLEQIDRELEAEFTP